VLQYQNVDSVSLRSRLLSAVLRRTLKPLLSRQDYDPLASRSKLQNGLPTRRAARGVAISTISEQLTGNALLRGEWQIPREASADHCILYLHGGGYMLGSPSQYRAVTSHLAKWAGASLFSLDYRLAPEQPFPAAVEDALLAFDYLCKRFAAERIVLMGDSAGGGLALALIHALKQRKLPLPGGAVVFSPYADLLASGDSVRENSERCAMFSAESVPRAASFYLQGADGRDPLASPLYGDFSGFPPLCIFVSDSEIIRDDGIRIAHKASAAGVPVRLNIWRNQPHAWPAFYPLLPEAERCLREAAEWFGTLFGFRKVAASEAQNRDIAAPANPCSKTPD